MANRFAAAMARLPLVAILRGLKPEEAPAILEALLAQGFSLIEIPLNSPEPFASIATMRKIGAAGDLYWRRHRPQRRRRGQVADAGGDLIVMPHADVAVIAAAKARGLACVPGVATPTEAFAALAAGADGLKAFPAEMITPAVVKAWRAVVPRSVAVMLVGGITPDGMAVYVAAAPAASASARPFIGPATRPPKWRRAPPPSSRLGARWLRQPKPRKSTPPARRG